MHVVAVSGVPAQLLTSGAGEDALEMEVKLQQITRMLSGKVRRAGQILGRRAGVSMAYAGLLLLLLLLPRVGPLGQAQVGV